MNNQELDTQDINAEFSEYFANAPKASLVEIAKRRLGPKNDKVTDDDYQNEVTNFIKGMPSTLHHPDADSTVRPVWKKALADLQQLIEPMPDTVWQLAYKYFPDEVEFCETDKDKQGAISDTFGLPKNSIDATNQLKDIVKEKICETPFTIRKNKMTLFSPAEAQSKTPKELCDKIQDNINQMTSYLDDYESDFKTYREARQTNTFADYFRALAGFLNKKFAEILRDKDGNRIYNVVYDENNNRLVCNHIVRQLEVITVMPNISDEDDTGNPEDLICDINVAGLGLPEVNPSVHDTRDMMEVQTYIMEHGKYSPGKDGQYSITYVKGSEVPAIVYKALQEWQATSTACGIIAKGWENARITMGGSENLDDLKRAFSANKVLQDLGNSTSKISAKYPKVFSDEIDKLNKQANVVKKRIGKKEDVSQAISELQAALRDGLGWN